MFAGFVAVTAVEAMKSTDWRRWLFWPLAASCLALAIAWPLVKSLYAPATAFVVALATNSQTWFILAVLAFVSVAVTGRKRSAPQPLNQQIAPGIEEQLSALEERLLLKLSGPKAELEGEPESPRLDLVFGQHAHTPTTTAMKNVHSWYVFVQNIEGIAPDGRQEHLKEWTYIFIVFEEDIHISTVKINSNRSLPSWSVLNQGTRHILINIDGAISENSHKYYYE